MTNAPGQVENLRDELLPAPEHDPDADNKPRMPFKTSYVLTREQEDALVAHSLARIEQLEGQLGREFREDGAGGGKGQTMFATIKNQHSWMGKRERYTLDYYNHIDYRAVPDTVYAESNQTASLAQRIAMQMIARAIIFFFGQPDDIDWFSSSAVGAEDDTLSDKIKKHARWKVDQCGVKHRFIDGIEFAFVRGEAVMKVTHQERGQVFKRTSTILKVPEDSELARKAREAGMEPEDGMLPGLDANGDYICQGDRFVDEMAEAPPAPEPGLVSKAVGVVKNFLAGGTGPEPGAIDGGVNPNAAEQQPQLQPTGRKILKRDGVTVLPEEPVWETKLVTRNLVTFEGPEAEIVYWKDFLCPEDATDVQRADLVAHLYDKTVMQVARMFRGQFGEGDAAIEDMTAAIERLRDMLNLSNAPKAAAGQPRTDFKETDTTGATGVPKVLMAECHETYDADGDGVEEEIMLVLDRINKVPIYYEYEANVTVKGIRPFQVWRPMPVDGRWYGMGAMELLDPETKFIDQQISRYDFRTSSAGITPFWQAANTAEGSRDADLKFHTGKTYTLINGKTKEETLGFVEIPTDAKALEYLINLYMQIAQNKSGVLNGADRATSGLPSSDTLGEEEIITNSGDELYTRMLAHLFPGVKGSLSAVIDVIYANLNRVEVFNYFNGEADEILSLDPDEVRDLPLNVTLELSRTQARKALENSEKATALVSWFYSLPVQLQQRVSAYARQQLKALGVSQADKIIDPLDLSGGRPQNKVSESINYKDARPGIKAQIEQQAGLDPNAPAPPGMEAEQTEHDQTVNPPKTDKTKPTGPAV
jgi:hypothetical protein